MCKGITTNEAVASAIQLTPIDEGFKELSKASLLDLPGSIPDAPLPNDEADLDSLLQPVSQRPGGRGPRYGYIWHCRLTLDSAAARRPELTSMSLVAQTVGISDAHIAGLKKFEYVEGLDRLRGILLWDVQSNANGLSHECRRKNAAAGCERNELHRVSKHFDLAKLRSRADLASYILPHVCISLDYQAFWCDWEGIIYLSESFLLSPSESWNTFLRMLVSTLQQLTQEFNRQDYYNFGDESQRAHVTRINFGLLSFNYLSHSPIRNYYDLPRPPENHHTLSYSLNRRSYLSMSGQIRQREWLEERNGKLEGKYYSLSYFQNAWHPSFFIHHDLAGKDDEPAVEVRKRRGDVHDKLTIFLEDSEGWGCLGQANEVKKYCRGFKLEDIQDGVGEAVTQRRAWVDDRNSPFLTGVGNVRLCENRLTATGLWRYLRQPQYNLKDQPDAERRLIYIPDLSPNFILALAATASFNQAPVLRDALCKHVTFRPSIRVKVPSDGMPTFQMEFHLPYFTLRRASPNCSAPKARGKRLRDLKYLFFLKEGEDEGEDEETFILSQAQISCVVYGYNEWQWIVYAFDDTGHTEQDQEEDEEEEEGELEEAEEAEEGGDDSAEATLHGKLVEDPILRGVDANRPIWQPRQYYLKAFDIQAEKVGKEWDRLVHKLVVDTSAYKRTHSFTWSSAFSDFYESAFDLLESDSRVHAVRSFRSTKETFGRLQSHQQKLRSLIAKLTRDLEALKLRLFLEGNEAAEYSSFTSKFSIWVLCPVTLAATIFSMQPTVIPFSLTPGWYCITVFILFGAMLMIHWIMKNWTLLPKVLAVRMKLARLEGAGHDLGKESQSNGVADVYPNRTRIDLESFFPATAP